jgi:sulfate permease, SulP family
MQHNIATNIRAGFTIALVSMPVSISLAVASRVDPIQGIITAIWAGLIASLFGGSNYNIIGATGALSGIIATSVLTFGIESISTLAIMAGLFMLCAYVLRLERYLIFIPSSVLHGFTLGVACIIALGQLPFICGLRNLPIHKEFSANVWEALQHMPELSFMPCAIFITFFCALSLLRNLITMIPAAVLLSPLGMLIGYKLGTPALETIGSKYGEIPVNLIRVPTISFNWGLLWPALVIALIAILETMLSAKIADSMTKTRHNSRKEMLGLGLANIVSGLCGGIPATAALARTAYNINNGATDKLSATVSSISIAIISLLFLPYFKYMPMSVIAAILVNAAYGMVKREHFDRLYQHDKTNFCIALLVTGITIYKDPIIGILVGTGCSLLFFLEQLSNGFYESSILYEKKTLEDDRDTHVRTIAQKNGVLLYTFKGKLSYINSQAHITRFEMDPVDYQAVILSLQEVYYIDIDGVCAFDEIIDTVLARHQKLSVCSVNPLVKNLLHAASVHFRTLEQAGLVFETSSTALHHSCTIGNDAHHGSRVF